MQWSFLLLALLLLPAASGIGISGNHLRRTIIYEPGIEFSETYNLITGEVPTQDYEFFVEMPAHNPAINFTPYVRLDKSSLSQIPGNINIPFTVTVSLPPNLNTPGFYDVWFGGRETQAFGGGGNLGVMARAVAVLTIIVPYPVPFSHSSFTAKNTNVEDEAEIYFEIQNLGRGTLRATGSADIYDGQGKWLEKLRMGTAQISFTQTQVLRTTFSTQGLPPAMYTAKGQLQWGEGNESNFTSTFQVGTLSAELVGITREIRAGEINKMYITTKSSWNNIIKSAYAKVTLNQGGKSVSMETVTRPIDPWQQTTLEGYLDAQDLEPGTVDAIVDLYFDGHHTSAVFPLTISAVPEPEQQITATATSYIIPKPILFSIIGLLLLLVVLLAFKIFLPKKTPKMISTQVIGSGSATTDSTVGSAEASAWTHSPPKTQPSIQSTSPSRARELSQNSPQDGQDRRP